MNRKCTASKFKAEFSSVNFCNSELVPTILALEESRKQMPYMRMSGDRHKNLVLEF